MVIMADDDYRFIMLNFIRCECYCRLIFKKGWKSTYYIDGRDPLYIAAATGSFEFV